ncbi:MAG: 50S ribosomal protein L4 [Bacteroidota bacterium]|nr:50S ribosomal protein L4 [Bacteroidota bacterium]
MKLDIVNIEGSKTGRTVELPDEIFAADPHDHSIWLAVKQHLAARRQGTHKVKTRAEVKGSSKKLHKQKGTGGSRKGNIRNPLYKGGGTVFGPKPHGYDIKLNRKVKDLAKIGALSNKASENRIVVVEDINMAEPATGKFSQIIHTIVPESRRTLFVMPEYDENVYKSYRNVPEICGTVLSDINTYDILNADTLVFTESAAKVFEGQEQEEATAK